MLFEDKDEMDRTKTEEHCYAQGEMCQKHDIEKTAMRRCTSRGFYICVVQRRTLG